MALSDKRKDLPSKNVGIISFYYHNRNLGGLLQAYALNHAVRSMGFSAEHISHRIPLSPPGSSLKVKLKCWVMGHHVSAVLWAMVALFRNKRYLIERSFMSVERRIPHSKFVGSIKALKRVSKKYDCMIAGSDQIWNPLFVNTDDRVRLLGLCFCPEGIRKISYAASIGSEKAGVGKEPLFQEILSGLDHISVREFAAREFLQPLTDKPVEVVLDPTLLLTRREWFELAPKRTDRVPFAFCYFLNTVNPDYMQEVKRAAELAGTALWCIGEDNTRSDSDDRLILNAGPKEFIGYIRDSEMVLTNSFHGTVFSVLFHKPFWVFKRFKDSEKGSMNARITGLLSSLGLEDRLVNEGEVLTEDMLHKLIDYERVDRLLEEKRQFSLNWLKTALEGI